MRLKKKLNDNAEFNFWQPTSDMFSALLLVFMLVILLLGLYLVHIPDQKEIDPNWGDAADAGQVSMTPFLDWRDDSGGHDDDGGGDDGGETPIPTMDVTPSPSPTPTPTPTPYIGSPGAGGGGEGVGGSEGSDEGPGEGLKSAVYVMLVDGDTDRTIKEPNVQFELYGLDGALQVLNTYYPERISFRIYETTESGTFYFPEKLLMGDYELHELTEPEGYDPAKNVQFVVDELYDWPEPLVVKVPIYPSRNVIYIKMTDADTGQPISGGTFDVISVENVITLDGTLRYRSGQVVSEIVLDEEGVGVSEDVYLGTFLVRQRDIPEYYASLEEDVEATVEKRGAKEPPAYPVVSERSKIRIRLMDELTPTKGIGNASFSVFSSGPNGSRTEQITDNSGEILLDSLEKGASYQITQLSSGSHYRLDPSTYTINVGMDGRIDGEAETRLEIYNHMIRVSIGIVDEFSRMQLPNINLSLYDSGGTMIHAWATTGDTLMFNDLEPGYYYILREDDINTRYDFEVKDIAEVQNVNLTGTYLMRYIIIGAAAALVLIIAIVIVLLVRRRRRNRS